MAEPAAETLPFAASDVVAEVIRWQAFLANERRMSPKTVEAYARDASQFLAFQAEHLGGKVTLARLVKLTPADVRAFMASRRADGIGSRSLMRALAGVRSFTRFLEREGKGRVSAVAAVRAPKIAKTLPKPIGIGAAKQLADVDLRAGEEREPWVFARDAAVRGYAETLDGWTAELRVSRDHPGAQEDIAIMRSCRGGEARHTAR